jgi:hypothetical protein
MSVISVPQNAGYMGSECQFWVKDNAKILCFVSPKYVLIKNLYWMRTAAIVYVRIILKPSSYLTGNALRLRYKAQPVNIV